MSWAVIFGKLIGMRRVRGGNETFEREFWSGRSLTEMNQAIGSKPSTAPMERIFASGMREFLKLRERRLAAETLLCLGCVALSCDALLDYPFGRPETLLVFVVGADNVEDAAPQMGGHLLRQTRDAQAGRADHLPGVGIW